MPVPTARPKSILMAWEVEHPQPEHEDHEPKTPSPSDIPSKKTFTVSLECNFCHSKFLYTGPYSQKNNPQGYPVYCPKHKGKTERKPVECPTPTKKKFPSEQFALRAALGASHNYMHPTRVYKCPSGQHWHFTKSRARNME